DADTCPPTLQAVDGGSVSATTTGFVDDFALSCADNSGGHPDLAFGLTLAQDSDVTAHVQSADGHQTAVAIVEISGGVCGRELLCNADAASANSEVDVVNLAAGSYAIVVDGDGS